MEESCGVFGAWAPGRSVARLAFDGLFALQHRGQESAGMAVSDGSTITVVKDMGLVTTVFDERSMECLPGELVVGHTRYSTAGPRDWKYAQPVYRSSGLAGFALAHNGNLTNTRELSERAGFNGPLAVSDTELLAELLEQEMDTLERSGQPATLSAALSVVLRQIEGAFSLVLMDVSHLYAIRDPHGFRPLCLGVLEPHEGDNDDGTTESSHRFFLDSVSVRSDGDSSSTWHGRDLQGHASEVEKYTDRGGIKDGNLGWVVASETPALDIVGARFVREIDPGEMVVVDDTGLHSFRLFDEEEVDPRLCIFEFVYFARPDAILNGSEVHGARRRMGELLALQTPSDADMVMGVPDSGIPAAEGFARASGIPYGQGLVKNRYIGRTFISPGQQARRVGVLRKLNPLKQSIKGKKLVVVDDSIVRGTTTKAIVEMLRSAGAAQVHLRISSPPFVWPCFYGIDTPSKSELLAANMTTNEIASYLDADSLEYLSLDNLLAALPPGGYCTACLTGHYPVKVDSALSKTSKDDQLGRYATYPKGK
ncbi:MAG: class II glutamine amidotransferase [Actinobacteria bacterium]|nr:class II glutamine amidotransferase [Actinomycetota bacterium]MCL6095688.1 class II glutamine amidotransferase [Actinomycetota bacterium]